MMKRLLTSFLIAISFCTFSQKYQPMDSTMVWNDSFYQINMNYGTCAHPCNYEIANASFQFHGYEMNNGAMWLRMFKSQIHSWAPCQTPCYSNSYNFPQFTDQFIGYLWDDTLAKKVYYTHTLTANFTPSTNDIMYDFLNKNVGDSLSWSSIGPYGPSQMPVPSNYKFQILNIDSMLFANKYHKMYTVKNNSVLPFSISVVEGIGSFLGAFSSVFTDFEAGSRLVCASKGLNGLSQTSYTTYAIGASGCGTINAVQEIEAPVLSIHPNPVSTHLSIENIQYENLIVADIFGKIVLEQNYYSPKIAVQHLPTGLYFLRLRSGDAIYSSKFIKE